MGPIASNKVNIDLDEIQEKWVGGGLVPMGMVSTDHCGEVIRFFCLFQEFTNPEPEGMPMVVQLFYNGETEKVVGVGWKEGDTWWFFDRVCTGEWKQIKPDPEK